MKTIVFENSNIVVIDKPAGVLSVPSRAGKRDPRPCAQIQLSQHLGCQIFPIHRLDLEVSGLLIFAKTSEAQRDFSMAFESREVKKTYQAWTSHLPTRSSAEFEMQTQILRGKKRAYESPVGKLAITQFIFQGSTFSPRLQHEWDEWKVLPLTGRGHQIRFHFFKMGAPIVGDSLYGSTVNFLDNAIALRAIELDFTKVSSLKQYDIPLKFSCSPLEAFFFSQNPSK